MNIKTLSAVMIFTLILSLSAFSADKAPNFELVDLNGNKVSLSDFTGKVVLLNFWATWCPPCRAEIPHFIEFQDKYSEKGFITLGVSLDQKDAGFVKNFVMKNGINYPVMMQDNSITGTYQKFIDSSMRGSIPFTFIIDREGYIAKTYVGSREKGVFERDILEVFKK